jgi:hypothetical protein
MKNGTSKEPKAPSELPPELPAAAPSEAGAWGGSGGWGVRGAECRRVGVGREGRCEAPPRGDHSRAWAANSARTVAASTRLG